jgi:hypothetical protein
VLDDPHADPREVPDRVKGDQRVVRARLNAPVAAGEVGVEVLVGQRRQVDERRGRCRCGRLDEITWSAIAMPMQISTRS